MIPLHAVVLFRRNRERRNRYWVGLRARFHDPYALGPVRAVVGDGFIQHDRQIPVGEGKSSVGTAAEWGGSSSGALGG